jgi:hypothetical protein
MHMIRHQAVPQQAQFMKLNVLPQELQVNQALAIRRKDELPRVAPLRHVVPNINCNDTGQTRHLNKIAENVPSVPISPISRRPRVGRASPFLPRPQAVLIPASLCFPFDITFLLAPLNHIHFPADYGEQVNQA